MTAHDFPTPPCLLSGANTVIPAQRRGGVTSGGMVLGIGNAHLAGPWKVSANPPKAWIGVNLLDTLGHS